MAGRQRDFLYRARMAYKPDKRNKRFMAGQVQTLSDADMLDLALYFCKQKGLYLKY